MKKNLIVCFIALVFMIHAEVKTPTDPADPDAKSSVNKSKYNVTFKKQNGFFYKGYVEDITGFYLDNLTWDGNADGNQKKLIDFVKSINIKGYSVSKKTFDNLSLVYYVPHVFDIELKNGEIIKGAQGRIKQFESFDAYDETGKEKCFTYFVRYWLEDKGIFSDNKSTDFGETPPLSKDVVTFIEFTK